MLGCAENASGVRRLWKALRHDTPDAAETADRKAIDANGRPLAQVFKTAYAGHTGKLSYARVWRGSITDGATLDGTRLGGIYHFTNGELTKTPEAKQGDVVALGRLDGGADRRHGLGRRSRRRPCRSPNRRRRSTRWRSPRPTARMM